MAKVTFQRGNQLFVDNLPIVDGQLIYNTDTGETSLDVENRRIMTGRPSAKPKDEIFIVRVDKDLKPNQTFVKTQEAYLSGKYVVAIFEARGGIVGETMAPLVFFADSELMIFSVQFNPAMIQALTFYKDNRMDYSEAKIKTSELDNDAGFVKAVDSELSATSTNPVENQAVAKALEGKADKGGKWVLIEEYTLPEDSIFERTKEPDGTPYNFTNIICSIETSDRGVLNGGPTSVQFSKKPWYVETMYIDKSSQKSYYWSKVFKYNQNLFDIQSVNSNETSSKTSSQVLRQNFTAVGFLCEGNIKMLKTNCQLSSGTIIKIWAVRA